MKRHVRASVLAFATAVAVSAALPAVSGARPAAEAAATSATRLTAAADASVDAAKPRRSAGKAKTLRAGGRYRAFVRFTVPAGGAVEQATLRVYALGAAPKGLDARRTGAGWSEGKLTSRKAPRTGARLDRSGAGRAKRWIELDVTRAVSGAGQVAFVLTGAKPVALGAREDAKHAPQLVLTRADQTPAPASGVPAPTATGTPAQTVTATPTPEPNRAPAVTAAAGQTAAEATAKSFALGTFTDGDGPSPWTVDVDWGDGTPHDTFTAAATGALPARPHTYADDGARTVTVKVTDAAGASAGSSFAVTVAKAAVNTASAAADDEATVTEDDDVLVDVLGNDDAGEDDQTLTVSRITLYPEHGQAEIEGAGIRYTPEADYHGADAFTYEACDDGTPVKCDTATVSVDVEPVNDAPVTARHEVVVDADGDMLLDPAGADSPGPQESGQSVTITQVRPPSYGVAEKAPDGRVHYISRTGHGGPDWFDYRVCDDGAPQECTTGTVHLWVPTVRTVNAKAETAPLPGEQSYAEGVAIWRNDAAPSDSAVIVADRANESGGGTLVDGGLGVYGLDGSQTDYEAGGNPSTVDIRSGFAFPEGDAPIVAAGERPDDAQGHDRLRFYSLDPATRTMTARGIYGNDATEIVDAVAGTCLWHAADGIHIFVTHYSGEVDRAKLSWRAATSEVRLGTFVTGLTVAGPNNDGTGTGACAVDDANAKLYVAQEGKGLWQFDIDPDTGSGSPTLIDSVGNDGHLGDGIQSIAVARGAGADSGYLVAASQGGDHHVLYTRHGEYVRTVRIGAHGGIDGTSSLGIAAIGESMLPDFPDGMLLAGDKDNTGEADVPLSPNAKLVDLAQVTEDRPGESTPTFPERGADCTRPYTAGSPWNTAIGADPAYDPASALHVAAIGGSLSSDPDQFTYPVYEVDADTPLVPVALSGTFSEVTGGGTVLARRTGPITEQLPIPAGAGPAAGDDAQIILHDRATGAEWGLFELHKNGDGGWEATNGYVYNTGWNAVPPSGFGSRGAGVPYLTGLVRPCEIARGRIDHALAFAYDDPTPQWVYPATKSDGHSLLPADMPEGARLQLNPDLSEQDIIALGCTGPCLTIARAMQEYGMYLIDHAGHPKVMLEYRDTAAWSPAVDSRTVRPIPTNQLELLELGALQGP
jgi:myo-inositol-hexaphosphate 3-phosphohydrolase